MPFLIDQAGQLGGAAKSAWDWGVGGLDAQNKFRAPNTGIGEYDPTAWDRYNEEKRKYDEQAVFAQMQESQGGPHVDMPPPPEAPVSDPNAVRLWGDRKAATDLYSGDGGGGSGYGAQNLYRLNQAALGEGPSQAQDTLREGTGRAVSSAYSLGASAPGGGAQGAAMMSQAGWQAAQAGQQGARQASQLRAQEMADARSQLGQAVGQAAGVYQNQGRMDLDRAIANQNAAQGAAQINSGIAQKNADNRKGFVEKIFGALSDVRAKEGIVPMFASALPSQADDQAMQRGLGLAMQQQGEDAARRDALMQHNEALAAPKRSSGGGGGGLLGRIFSDARSKEKIRTLEDELDRVHGTAHEIRDTAVQYPAGFTAPRRVVAPTDLLFSGDDGGNFRTPSEQMKFLEDRGAGPSGIGLSPAAMAQKILATPAGSREALAPVNPYSYKYKPEFAAATGEDTTRRAGVMAQDLEASPNPAVRSAVVDTPMGKAIDGKRALSANLALSAGLDKRLASVEAALGQQTEYPSLGLAAPDDAALRRIKGSGRGRVPAKAELGY